MIDIRLPEILTTSLPGLIYTGDMFEDLDTDIDPEVIAGKMYAHELEILLQYQVNFE